MEEGKDIVGMDKSPFGYFMFHACKNLILEVTKMTYY